MTGKIFVGRRSRSRSENDKEESLRQIRAILTLVGWSLAIVAGLGIVSASQATSTLRGAISGVVTDAATGTPVEGALVSLAPAAGRQANRPAHQMTDGKGRFVFRSLGPFDEYRLTVARAGYLDGRYGPHRGAAGGSPISLAEGQWFATANVTLVPTATLSGRVIGDHDEGVAGAYVRAIRLFRLNGLDAVAAGPIATTDDRGMFTIDGLTPGRYVVQVPIVHSTVIAETNTPPASAASARDRYVVVDPDVRLLIGRYPTSRATAPGIGFRSLFYDQATSVAGASVLNLQPGDTRSGLECRLTPVPVYRVTGRIIGPADAFEDLTVRLVPEGSERLGDGGEVATGRVGTKGSFVMLNVPSGNYVLEVRRAVAQLEVRAFGNQVTALPRPPQAGGGNLASQAILGGPPGLRVTVRSTQGSERFFAREPVVVDRGDLMNLAVQLHRSTTLSGRFVWDPESPPASHGFPAQVRLEPADGDIAKGMPRSLPGRDVGATFTVEGVLPGEYLLTVAGSYRVRSVRWNGREYVGRPFEARPEQDIADVTVVLTTLHNAVQGMLTGGTDDDLIVLFPTDRSRSSKTGWSLAGLRLATQLPGGRFRVEDLPAGEYYAAVISSEDAESWSDPEVLRRAVAFAERFTIGWDSQVNVIVRARRAP
jgi:hypothetical protein